MTRRQGAFAALAALALLLVAGRAASAAWADWQWHVALGAEQVWRLQWRESMLARGLAFVVATAFAGANLAGVRQSILLLVLPRRVGNLEIGEQVPSAALNVAVAGIAALLGVGFAALAPGDGLLPYLGTAVPFDETDPYFGRDLGFFVYRLPVEAAWYEWAVLLVAGSGVAVVVLYALTPALRWQRGTLRMSGWVRRHLTVLGAAVLALLAWGLRLDTYALPIEGSGLDGMFTAVDHRVLVPGNLLLSVATLAGALVVLWAGWTGQLRVAFVAVTAVLGGALLVRGVLPIVGGQLVSDASRGGRSNSPRAEAVRDAPYRATRLSYTRRAFDVGAVRPATDLPLPAGPTEALGSVPAWDPAALRALVERSRPGQRVAGDIGWQVGGRYGLSIATAPSAGEAAAPWALATGDPRRDADGTGVPPLDDRPVEAVLVQDRGAGPLVVDDPTGRVAAPAFRGAGARLLHAWALQRPPLFTAAGNAEAPVLLTDRDVRRRVRRLAPALRQGDQIVPILEGDTLFWALDVYSASASYPLSRRLAVRGGDVHYFRHAGTALVNSATGRVRFAVRADADPIARTWLGRLGPLVIPRTALGPALATALPVPVAGARAQATALALAGTREEPSGAPRRLPVTDGADTLVAGPGSTMLAWPGGGAAWTTALLDGADSIVAVVIATGGVTPRTRVAPVTAGPGWGASLERLATSGEGLRGDLRRVPGRVRVVPTADGRVVLVQPRYSWPVAGPPSLDGVAAVVGGEVRHARTLIALGAPGEAGASEAPLDAAARQRLGPLYDRMRTALRRGDFAEFGQLLDQLGRWAGRVPERLREP